MTKDKKFFPRAEHIVWKRPASFLDPRKTANVFADAILPHDLKQGHLGNYYFLSALSILAEQPKLLRRLFNSKELNSHGCYSLWLNYEGEWIQQVIDDQFPCEDQGPCFSTAKGPELWVNLIEKAYAKLFGAYDKLEVGLCGHAMRDLTGAPYTYFVRDNDPSDMRAEDDVWKFIFQNLKQKPYFVIASTEKNERAMLSEHDRMGITSIFSYPILDVFDVEVSDGGVPHKEKILKLRNPWGKIEWNGEYSENSTKWTKNLTSKLRKQKEENVIFLTLNEFINTFSQICVSKVMPEYVYNSFRVAKAP